MYVIRRCERVSEPNLRKVEKRRVFCFCMSLELRNVRHNRASGNNCSCANQQERSFILYIISEEAERVFEVTGSIGAEISEGREPLESGDQYLHGCTYRRRGFAAIGRHTGALISGARAREAAKGTFIGIHTGEKTF